MSSSDVVDDEEKPVCCVAGWPGANWMMGASSMGWPVSLRLQGLAWQASFGQRFTRPRRLPHTRRLLLLLRRLLARLLSLTPVACGLTHYDCRPSITRLSFVSSTAHTHPRLSLPPTHPLPPSTRASFTLTFVPPSQAPPVRDRLPCICSAHCIPASASRFQPTARDAASLPNPIRALEEC